jgi:uncharacterized protein YfdQ (DUF2303 family)
MDQNENNHSDIAAAFNQGREHNQVIDFALPNGTSSEILVTHKDSKPNLELFEKLLPAPLHCETDVTLHDAQSFAEYVNKFGDDDTMVFIDLRDAKFVAIIDYHRADNDPQHGHHRVTYQCPKTPEWNTWLKHSGEKMSQVEFALFIEDNAEEITNPQGAQMLEIAGSLQATNKHDFSSAIKLDNGETQFAYNEVIDGKAGKNGQLDIPTEITVQLQPFQGGSAYERKARFRYRISNGGLMMWYDLVRPQKCIEDAVQDTLTQIKTQVSGCTFLMGNAPR